MLKRRIYRNMYLLTTVSILLTAIFLSISFYTLFNSQMQKNLSEKTMYFQKSLNFSPDNLAYVNSLNLAKDDVRLSIITHDGTVTFDSYKNLADLENHSDRPEVKEAFESGYAESRRRSETLGEDTYYCAMILSDNTVLRVSQTTSTFVTLFKQIVPLVCLIAIVILFLCNIASKRLTLMIIKPINELDLNGTNNADEKIYDELTPFIRTISDQKGQISRQLDELKTHSTTITAITKSMSEGLIILDHRATIISVNESAVNIFGKQNKNNVGKNIIEFTRDLDLIETVNASLDGKISRAMILVSNHRFEVIASPVFATSDVNLLTGVIVLLLDVTQKTNLEKQRKEFSANVSHELKTPLTTISGYAELIANGLVKSEDIAEFSGKIKSDADRLLNLIEDIIRLSELDENIGQMQFEEFDVMALATRTIASLGHIADEKSVKLHIIGDKTLITANQHMIDELLYNLLENAIKYNKQGGDVVVKIHADDDFVKIRVNDTGIGILPSQQERIFERFYRVDKSRSKKTGGTGLGLAIVKHIVSYHKGTISLTSDVGIGTAIEVALPK